MKRLAFIVIAAAVIGCSSTPPPPDWAVNAQGAMERSVSAYLAGNTRVAALDLERARAEVARTGAPARVARLELVQCAAEVASLVFTDCPAYQPLAPDAAEPEVAYARYLLAQATPADVPRLPEAQRGLVGATPEQAAARMAVIADPLSRLVAAGVLLRSERADPAVIQLAVDTASEQGWRRPLMAWLRVAVARAQTAGQTEEAARLQRRLALLAPGAPADASTPAQ